MDIDKNKNFVAQIAFTILLLKYRVLNYHILLLELK